MKSEEAIDIISSIFMWLLIVAGMLLVILFVYAVVSDIFVDKPKEPTMECIEGKVYDITYHDKIKVHDKQPFKTCEEIK